MCEKVMIIKALRFYGHRTGESYNIIENSAAWWNKEVLTDKPGLSVSVWWMIEQAMAVRDPEVLRDE